MFISSSRAIRRSNLKSGAYFVISVLYSTETFAPTPSSTKHNKPNIYVNPKCNKRHAAATRHK